MNAIEINDLQKTLGDFTLDIPRLVLPSGCILGLIGENGAGKTTVIKLMTGAIHPESGIITLLGKTGKELALGRQDVGVVMDEVGLSSSLTVNQVGSIMADIFTNWDQKIYEELLKKFRLPYGERFKTFSRGMKMKLGLAVALSHHPRLLLLDEATSGLDPVVRDELLDIFLDFTRDEEHSILISSHIVSDLEKVCDYIAFLREGQLTLFAEKDRLLEDYGVLHCTAQQLAEIAPSAIVGKKVTAYGAEALVRRSGVPDGIDLSPADIEQLFICMSKEAE